MDLSANNCLVDTDWLARHLDSPDLRIIECTSLLPNYFEESAADGLIKESGLTLWQEGHVPGSAFADILGELSDETSDRLMYGIPSTTQFSEAMSNLGVDASTGVVLYDRQLNMWAARVWWLLRAFGFENAVVLNGGWTKWVAEDRPVSTAPPSYPRSEFVARPQPQLIAKRDEVHAAIDRDASCLINALQADEFEGKPPHRYARPGRIAGSVNVPFSTTCDPETQLYGTDDELRATFDSAGAMSSAETICYCGGGIAACSTALLLTRLGVEGVSVYDGSMTELASDPSLPMETD